MAKELVLDVVTKANPKDLILLAQEFELLSKEIDGANKSAQQNVTFGKFLDEQIASTKKQVQELTEELNKTGNADVFARLRGTQRNLDVLTRYRKQLGDVSEAQQETTKELEGSDKVLRQVADEYQNLGADVRRVQQDYDNLTDRIKVQTDTVRRLQQQSRNDDSVALYARNASRALDRLKEQAEELKPVLDAAPEDAAKKFESFDQFVETRIIGQRRLVASLESDLRRTGNVSVFGDLKKAQGDLKELEDLGEKIGVTVERGLEDGAEKGIQFLGDAFGSLPPEVQAAIGAGIAGAISASAIFIGAALDGVFVGAIGGGAVALAISRQIKDPVVAGAVGDLKARIGADLTAATSAFGPVLIKDARELGSVFDKITPGLRAAFDSLAGPADHLFQAFGQFIEKAAPGFERLLSHGAGQILDELARDLPDVGHAFSVFFAELDAGAGGGADALHEVLAVLTFLIKATGAELNLLSGAFEILRAAKDAVTGDTTGFSDAITKLGQAFGNGATGADQFGSGLLNLGGGAKDASKAIDDLSASIDNLIGKNLSADQAAIQQKQSIADLSAALKENGNAWDINTDAGRKNQSALLAAIQAAEQKRQADIAAGGDAVKASEDYNKEVDSLLAIAAKAGDSKAALDALKGKYEIDVNEIYTTHFISEGTPPSQFFHGLAAGGPVTAGQPYIVGENGPELFMSDTAGQIIPNDKLKNLSGSVPPPNFRATSAAAQGSTVTFAGDTDGAFATAFQMLVRTGAIRIS